MYIHTYIHTYIHYSEAMVIDSKPEEMIFFTTYIYIYIYIYTYTYIVMLLS